MKKALKITGIVLLVILIILVLFLLEVFAYNKIMLKAEDELVLDAGRLND